MASSSSSSSWTLKQFDFFKADFIAGITIASLAVPQGISYAGLASLPPVIGLYSSFVPPLIYSMLGSSRDLAVGTVAVPSLLITSMVWGRRLTLIKTLSSMCSWFLLQPSLLGSSKPH